MAQNTKALLDHLGIQQVDVIAHSMGGMLGVRFALLFPETVERLVLENPLGLEDYRKLVPYISLQQQYAAELSQTYEKMRDYQKSYYPGAWKPEYEVYVRDQASVLSTGEYPRDARIRPARGNLGTAVDCAAGAGASIQVQRAVFPVAGG